MTTRNKILQQGIDIPLGGTVRIRCPECNEKECSCTRTAAGLLWKCHRLKCGSRGFISSIPGAYCHDETRKRPQHTTPTRELTDHERDVICQRYHLTPTDLRRCSALLVPEWKQESAGEQSSRQLDKQPSMRGSTTEKSAATGLLSALLKHPLLMNNHATYVLFPLTQESPSSNTNKSSELLSRPLLEKQVGYSAKLLRLTTTPASGRIPKSMTLLDGEATGLFWTPRVPGKNVLIVVEDCLSALAVQNAGYQACALLGTYLAPSAELLLSRELSRHALRGTTSGQKQCEVWIALDADATHKAAKIVQQLSLYTRCRQLVLTKDIKDCTLDERKELFKQLEV